MKDKAARRFQLTFNNPDQHGITHEVIRETFTSKLKSTRFFCMADECGTESNVLHTHCYCEFNSPVRFSTLKNCFKSAHIEQAFADAQSNIQYIKKSGRWKESEKGSTSIDGTYEEYGTPSIRSGQRTDLAEVLLKIESGASDYELLQSNPNNMRLLNFISRARSAMIKEKSAKVVRELDVFYVYGSTSTKRLEYIFDRFGIDVVCRIVNYQRNTFDNYNPETESVICFDNFKSSIPLQDMTALYLCGFPLTIGVRYCDKQALYTTVVISSRSRPDEQYLDCDANERREFFDKLNTIIQLGDDGTVTTYTGTEYFDPERLNKNFVNPFR